MKIAVKLFGTLGKRFAPYDPQRGMKVTLPEGSRVRDLLGHLEIPESSGGVATMEGRIVKPEEGLIDGATVHILQAGSGG